MNKKISLASVFAIQAAVIVYTFGSVMAKFASQHEFLSFWFLFFYGMEIVILGVYAIIWQQIIKRFDLSVAYVNRATAIFWSMLWAALLFSERITPKNLAGVALIFVGVMVVNSDGV